MVLALQLHPIMSVKVCKDHDHDEKIRKIKRQMCMLIRALIVQQKWNQKQAALALGASEQSVAYVVKGYTKRVTFNQLFHYLVSLNPDFTIAIITQPFLGCMVQ